LKNIENPEWKEQYEAQRQATEDKIAAKYEKEQKLKRKKERQQQKAQNAKLESKWKEESKENRSGLNSKPPDTKKWSQNYAKQTAATQRAIDKKYELKKAQQIADRKKFKEKAAEIEAKYDAKKPPKKSKKKSNKKAIVIDDQHNAFSAVKEGDFDLLERIGTHYPNDLKRKDKKNKNNILHHAINHWNRRLNRNEEMIEWLIPKLPSSFINAVNTFGNTPLFLAVFERKIKCIEALYSGPSKSKRPNPDHINLNGRTVLMHCAMRDDVEIIELLMNLQPPPTPDIFAEKSCKTALSYAVEHQKENAVRILVKHGASIWMKDRRGISIFDSAMKSSTVRILRIMIDLQRVDCVRGCVQSKIVRNLNVPDYLIALIAEFVASVPEEILKRERKEEKERKKKEKAAKRGNRRNRGRGRRARRGGNTGRQ